MATSQVVVLMRWYRNLKPWAKAGLLCLVLAMLIWLLGVNKVTDPEYVQFKVAPTSGWAPSSNLCSFESPYALRGFIWSHRGFDSENPRSVDASKENIQLMLEKGIRNFDIDVIVRNDPSAKAKCGDRDLKECFVVSHPLRYKSYLDANDDVSLKSVQTLDALLNQVEEYFTSSAFPADVTPPIISIEPKFYGTEELRKLVAVTQSSEFRVRHTALISVSQEVQGILESFMDYFREPGHHHSSGKNDPVDSLFNKYKFKSDGRAASNPRESLVGISVRTVPSSQGTDFMWNHDPQWWLQATATGEAGLPADVKVGASRSSKSEISGISYGGSDIECCTMTPYYSTKNRQVVFLDHKILAKQLATGEQGGGDGKFNSVCRRKGTYFITWVVDEVEDMFTQLEAGVDGIITNHPAKMMKALLDRHGKKCLPNL